MKPLMNESRLALVTLGLSLVFVVAFVAVYWVYTSQLALAQGADSTMDVVTALILTWSIAVAAQPGDHGHPFGHYRAEPIGALFAAIVAGVLAVEVLRSALGSLFSEPVVSFGWPLLLVFCCKIIAKVFVMISGKRMTGRNKSPAIRALVVDARNDIIVGLLAVVGYFAARYGWERLDAYLALPAGLWIGWAGVDLAQENIRLLMGEAPSVERQNELLQLANDVAGISNAHDIRAQYLGTHLGVHLHVVVDPRLTIMQAHDIGEKVRNKLETEHDVAHCAIHIDAEAIHINTE